ncbi:DUF547 domain-containing protein [soil metagenome]
MRSSIFVLALLGAGSLAAISSAHTPLNTPAEVLRESTGPVIAVHGDLPDPAAFTRVLREVVVVPNVDYSRLEANRGGLDRYLAELAATDPARLSAAPRDDQLAFWINAYNACMLRVVIDHYPIERQRLGLFQRARIAVAGYPANSVWQIRDVFDGKHCEVAGAPRSQDEIEHEIIRPRFGEPRIHFAVNCAARSCPVLWPEAYTGERLEEQLERAVRNLVGNPAHFRVVAENGPELRLNKVLDWYSEDFGGVEGLRTFFLTYLEGETLAQVRDPATPIRFFDYDWTLNDTSR